MKKKELIRRLQEIEGNPDVYFKDHDQEKYEVNNRVFEAKLMDTDENPSKEPHHVQEGKYIVLSP